MYQRHEIGRIGEEVSVKYLEQKNYKIVERNFECTQGEIDIIAFDLYKKELVFIEVKTRTNLQYGNPAEAVDQTKQKHIYKSAQYYIYTKKIENEFIRIDVIEIYILKNKYKINHIKQII